MQSRQRLVGGNNALRNMLIASISHEPTQLLDHFVRQLSTTFFTPIGGVFTLACQLSSKLWLM